MNITALPFDTEVTEFMLAKDAKVIAEEERAKLPNLIYNEIRTHLMSRIPRNARNRYAFLEHFTSIFKKDEASIYIDVVKKIIQELEDLGYTVEARLIDYNGANYKITMYITWDLEYILSDEKLTNNWKSIDKYNIIEVIKTDKPVEDKPKEEESK